MAGLWSEANRTATFTPDEASPFYSDAEAASFEQLTDYVGIRRNCRAEAFFFSKNEGCLAGAWVKTFIDGTPMVFIFVPRSTPSRGD